MEVMLPEIDESVESILAASSINTAYFGKLFLDDIFTAPYNVLHNEIFSLIDSGYKRVVIAAPRGIGKTSIVRARIIRDILFRKVHFVVYISHSETMAIMQTENIKSELMGNPTIKKFFGDVTVSYSKTGDETFSKKSWVAFGDVFVLPRGAKQQVRGLNWRNHRPDLIIIDDLEDIKEVKNEQLRFELKQWFFGDVMKSIDKYRNDWTVIYIDTLKHEDSLLQTLLDSQDWIGTTLSVCDDDLVSKVPDYMTTEEIKAEYESALEKGVVDTFYMELMNKATGGKHAPFKAEYFRHYNEDDEFFVKLLEERQIETVVLVDPGRTKTAHSADTAIVGIGVDLRGNRLFIRDIVARPMTPDELYAEMFAMADRLEARVIGVEDKGLKEFIQQPIKNEMMRRGKMYELIWLIPRRGVEEAGKVERIRSLVPYYRQGLVYHNKQVCSILEQQLLSFPKAKKWDVMDVTAYIVEMMDVGGRFFYPKDLVDDPNYDVEQEYKELEQLDEEPIPDDWMVI